MLLHIAVLVKYGVMLFFPDSDHNYQNISSTLVWTVSAQFILIATKHCSVLSREDEC